MIIINTTKKAWDRLGKNKGLVLVQEESFLGSWCAHIFHSGRNQYLVITNEKTLLTVVLPAKDLQRISEVLPQSIDEILQKYGLEKLMRDKFTQQLTTVQFSRNTKRQVLGSMNDFIRMSKFMLGDEPSLSLMELSLQLCNAPCSPLQMKSPKKATMELLIKGVKY